MKPLDQCRLYAFIDEAYRSGRPYQDLAKSLCDGGADLIQLRMKDAPPENVLAAAEKIHPITESAGVYLIINDHLDIAYQMPHPFVHLGQEDFFDQGHTQVCELCPKHNPRHLMTGLSTHAPAQAQRAIASGADYVAIGPVFATPTKPTATPVTLDYVRWAAENIRIPWFAIGGIHAGNVDHIIEAGAQRICVVSDILKASDPQKACALFKTRLTSVN